MNKCVGLSVALLTVACGGGESYAPSIEALNLSAPLFEATSGECGIDPSAREVLDGWLAPVRERVGAPGSLLDQIRDSSPRVINEEQVEWSASTSVQELGLTQRFVGTHYELALLYSESSSAGAFSWAEGTMAVDQNSGAWRIYGWNGQPKMDVAWERAGEQLSVTHEMTGSSRTALRVRAAGAETVTLQEDAETAAVAQWDFDRNRGFVVIAGNRTCLEQSNGSMCQRVCEGGQ